NPRKELEEQLQQHIAQSQAIYILADAVARSGIEEIYGKALDAIQLALKVDRASLLLFDLDGVMRFKAWRGLSDEYRVAVEGHSPWTRDTKDPEPITVGDIQIEPGYEELRPVIGAEGIRSLAFIPLVNEATLLGKFMLYHDTPHDFTASEVRLAQTIAGHIAFAISRKRSEETLRDAEERYRGIFEKAVVGVFQTTPDGRFLTVNESLARILGYDSSDDLIASITDIANQIHVDPERRAEFARILDEAGAVHDFEAQAYRKDGSIIWISLSARALRGKDGALEGYEGILEDVSARMRAEQGLAESEFRYRTIFNSAGVSLWEEDFTLVKQMLEVLRRKGVKDLRKYLGNHPEFVDEAIAAVKVLDVNEHSVGLFGATDKIELMRSLNDIFVPETREIFQEELLRLDRGERFFQSETVLKRLDGRRLNVLFSISFPDEPSLSNPAMVTVTDITERKLEEERQLFLAEASAILSSSLDYETTLDNVARLVAGRLGDLCSIDLVEGEDVRRVALAHVDQTKQALFAGMEPAYRAQSDRHPLLRVMSTGRSVLINGISDETIRDSARDAKHLKALRALKMKSVMIVPLSVGSRVLGAITVVSAESARSYNQADLSLAEELSRRAGIAIDNAELYRAREAAREAAQSAADRTTRLQAVTAALSEAVTPSEVANVVAQAA
ncbi:MAG TPA: GAF domain-containing protein, partial [Gemmatimonadaceae bacterium]|nr:GAF domain-containing protein [Gemmatimonadaceae bacterium]